MFQEKAVQDKKDEEKDTQDKAMVASVSSDRSPKKWVFPACRRYLVDSGATAHKVKN